MISEDIRRGGRLSCRPEQIRPEYFSRRLLQFLWESYRVETEVRPIKPSRYEVPTQAVFDGAFLKRLTVRETRYLNWRLRSQLSFRLIGQVMNVTPRTVYGYARQVHRKWIAYLEEETAHGVE